MTAVYYINLEEQKERNEQVNKELSKIFDKDKIHRVNAIKHQNGAYGCTCSHLLLLDIAENSDDDIICVFEDDFQLELSPSEASAMLEKIYKQDWDLVLLSYHIKVVQLSDFNECLARVKNGQTTVAYMFRKSYIPELRQVFIKSRDNILTGDPNIYAIDQSWKELQNSTKTYAMIPRLGGQAPGFSSITNNIENYGGGLFMVILSCKKYKSRRDVQNLTNCPFPYKYFIGSNESEPRVEGDIVYLPCGDEYEDLATKTYQALQWVRSNYKNMDWVFKTDDDITFDFQKLYAIWTCISFNNINYAGNFIWCKKPHVSTYHYGKCTDKKKEVPMNINSEVVYCSGGGYFLSRYAMEICTASEHIYRNNIFEDQATGLALNAVGIRPISLPILQDKICVW